jgi:hypothetical protein
MVRSGSGGSAKPGKPYHYHWPRGRSKREVRVWGELRWGWGHEVRCEVWGAEADTRCWCDAVSFSDADVPDDVARSDAHVMMRWCDADAVMRCVMPMRCDAMLWCFDAIAIARRETMMLERLRCDAIARWCRCEGAMMRDAMIARARYAIWCDMRW